MSPGQFWGVEGMLEDYKNADLTSTETLLVNLMGVKVPIVFSQLSSTCADEYNYQVGV